MFKLRSPQEQVRNFIVCLFVFVALRPKSTGMVIAGRSVHLTTLFSWAGLNKRLTSNLCTYISVARHVTDCATRPGRNFIVNNAYFGKT